MGVFIQVVMGLVFELNMGCAVSAAFEIQFQDANPLQCNTDHIVPGEEIPF
jgi:hypothetical protein